MLRPWLALALALHVVFAACYAFTTPSFEAPDENSHFEYAWQLGNARRLPLASALAAARGLPQTEGAVLAHHPPAYYALLGAVLAATGTDDTVFGPQVNPDFGAPDRPGRCLKFVHGTGQGDGVLHLLRAVSVLLGAATVWLVHRLGRACVPQQPRVADLAALLVACLPMWSFLHGALNSDVLATLLATATIGSLAHLARAARLGRLHAVQLGGLLGASLLTKLTTLFLVPLALLAAWPAVRAARRDGVLAPLLRRVGLAAATTLLVSGWWFVRNVVLYGEPLALAAHDAAFPPLPPEVRWEWLTGDFVPTLFGSLAGHFGWFSLAPHPWLVAALAAVAGFGVAGVVRAALDRGRPLLPAPAWLLVGALLLVFAGTAQFNWRAPQPQGRLLFPAIGPAAVLLAAGLVRLTSRLHWRRWLAALPPLAAVVVFFGWFRPAFAPELAPAPASHRALVGGIARDDGASTPAITWLESAANELRWNDPGAPPDARYTLYAFDDAGRVWLATHEWSNGKIVFRGGAATLDPALVAFLPADHELLLRLRRVPDAADQDPATLPASAPRRWRRS